MFQCIYLYNFYYDYNFFFFNHAACCRLLMGKSCLTKLVSVFSLGSNDMLALLGVPKHFMLKCFDFTWVNTHTQPVFALLDHALWPGNDRRCWVHAHLFHVVFKCGFFLNNYLTMLLFDRCLLLSQIHFNSPTH